MNAMMKISGHRLQVNDPARSLAFYRNKLGMFLIAHYCIGEIRHYFLSFNKDQDAVLELVHAPRKDFSVSPQPSKTEGYWKFSIAVPNLQQARDQLVQNGISVSDSFEVPDIAYLCHLADPDGYCIELIQHHFKHNTQPVAAKLNHPLHCMPTLNLSTLRVKNINESLTFYRSLGMVLLSRQQVPTRGMTLYFLSFEMEQAPSADIDAVDIREWLWQRPYTLLELQHIHGTEKQPHFSYHTDTDSGFLGLDLSNVKKAAQRADGVNAQFHISEGAVDGVILRDPDGYILRCY